MRRPVPGRPYRPAQRGRSGSRAPPRSPRSLWKTNARRFARDKPKKPLRLRIGKSAAGISKTGSDSARKASGPENGTLSNLYSQAGFPETAGGPAEGLAERQARTTVLVAELV